MKCVIIESPLAGDVVRNVAYTRCCMLDSLRRGESPFASHLLYTQVLDDLLPEERSRGIAAGLEWGHKADATVTYVDFGVSNGMKLGIRAAINASRIIIERRLEKDNAFTAKDLASKLVRRMLTYLELGRGTNGEWIPYENLLVTE